jgi:hypothetical protein
MLFYLESYWIFVNNMQHMDRNKRTTERIKTGFKTNIIFDCKQYTVTVENLCISGANLLTDPIDHDIQFLDGNNIELEFEAHTGKIVLLKCIVIWSSKIPPRNERHRIGVEIIELPIDKFDFRL